MKQRDFSVDDASDALTNPLDIGKKRADNTQQYIGEKATVAVNTSTGKLTTGWKTSSKKVKKLKEKNNASSQG